MSISPENSITNTNPTALNSKPDNIPAVSIVTAEDITTGNILDANKIRALLLSEEINIRESLIAVLKEGLSALKPVVCDKEISYEPDYLTRLKYTEVMLEILGERKKEEVFSGSVNIYIELDNRIKESRKAAFGRDNDY